METETATASQSTVENVVEQIMDIVTSTTKTVERFDFAARPLGRVTVPDINSIRRKITALLNMKVRRDDEWKGHM